MDEVEERRIDEFVHNQYTSVVRDLVNNITERADGFSCHPNAGTAADGVDFIYDENLLKVPSHLQSVSLFLQSVSLFLQSVSLYRILRHILSKDEGY